MEEGVHTQHDLGIPNVQLGGVIGGGGFAKVYRAWDRLLRRELAVKILRPLSGLAMREAFENEAGSHGPLSRHPNIVTVHHAGVTVTEERPYLVMDFVSGGSLEDRLVAAGPVPWQHAVRWMIPICGAVQHAHEKGILHRDIKPANILLDPPSTPQLSDFGIACLEDDTTPMEAMSVSHVAPEALRGERREAPSDVFSLGTTLYHLVTGELPFGSSLIDRVQRLDRPAAGIPPEIDAPPWLDETLRRAMDPDVANRTSSAGELQQLLEAGMGNTASRLATIAARPPTAPPDRPVPEPTTAGGPSGRQPGTPITEVDGKRSRPRRAWVVSAVLAVVIASAGGLLAWRLISQEADGEAVTSTGDEPGAVEGVDPDEVASAAAPVPALIGLSESEATRLLEADGFKPEVRPVDRPPGSAELGVVVSQDPVEGTESESGAVVAIEVGRVATSTVPLVLGLPASDAESELEAAGFAPRILFVDRQPGSPDIGSVVRQDPTGGGEAASGSEVVIEVGQSSGVVVPDALGLAGSDALIRLRGAGLEPILEQVDRPLGSPDVDVVVDQVPAGGIEVVAGSEVAVTVGRSPGLADTFWLVSGYNVDGQDTTGGSGLIFFGFDADGQVAGTASCDRFEARYTEDGNTLSITDIRITETIASCTVQPGAGEAQAVFLIALEEVTSIRARSDVELELVTRDGDAIVVVDDKDL